MCVQVVVLNADVIYMPFWLYRTACYWPGCSSHVSQWACPFTAYVTAASLSTWHGATSFLLCLIFLSCFGLCPCLPVCSSSKCLKTVWTKVCLFPTVQPSKQSKPIEINAISSSFLFPCRNAGTPFSFSLCFGWPHRAAESQRRPTLLSGIWGKSRQMTCAVSVWATLRSIVLTLYLLLKPPRDNCLMS